MGGQEEAGCFVGTIFPVLGDTSFLSHPEGTLDNAFLGLHMILALLLIAGPGDFFGEICPTRQSTAINMLKIQFHPLTELFKSLKK